MVDLDVLREVIRDNLIKIERAVGVSEHFTEYGGVFLREYNDQSAIVICSENDPIVYITIPTEEDMLYAGVDPDATMCLSVHSAIDEDLHGIIDVTNEETLLYKFLYPFYYVNLMDLEMSKLEITNGSSVTENQ